VRFKNDLSGGIAAIVPLWSVAGGPGGVGGIGGIGGGAGATGRTGRGLPTDYSHSGYDPGDPPANVNPPDRGKGATGTSGQSGPSGSVQIINKP
jgi:hypothetical protein